MCSELAVIASFQTNRPWWCTRFRGLILWVPGFNERCDAMSESTEP